MRASRVPAVLAALSLLALAGCGGGGGGGGGGTPTANLSGRVLDSNGVGMDGATVTANTGSRAIIQDVTENGGQFTLEGLPVRTDFTLTVSRWDIGTRTYQDIQLDTSGVSGSPTMDIVIAPSRPPAGSTIRITPTLTEVAMGTTPWFTVQVVTGGSVLYTSYYAAWMIAGGATGQVMSDSRFFRVSPDEEGSTVKLTAMVPLDDGSVATDTLNMPIVSEGDVEPPPPPPL